MPSPGSVTDLVLQHPADSGCIRCVAQTLWTIVSRTTLEIEFCLKAIDPVSVCGLRVQLDAPLSLHKVISRQSHFKGSRSSNTYRSNQKVCKPKCVINEYGSFTRGTCFLGLVRIRRLVHLLEIITDVECTVERANISRVCCRIDLIVNG
jgi:hypothetical protein